MLFVDPASPSLLVIGPSGTIGRVIVAPRPNDVMFLVHRDGSGTRPSRGLRLSRWQQGEWTEAAIRVAAHGRQHQGGVIDSAQTVMESVIVGFGARRKVYLGIRDTAGVHVVRAKVR